eukprot:CAMPEP_0184698848 /NCGR_PEP_ID=MMETSP0313-20130426/5318_1 /TAXON_ID=2792 /ORGANISM="Porphyridium aerugineum, Strain SAG 1380-2" /LENGTH=185 /DNA_ID=CAMNT_0027157839 /DNA_START=132 /DNA_END=687 /DNA_ORIENTATION=-
MAGDSGSLWPSWTIIPWEKFRHSDRAIFRRIRLINQLADNNIPSPSQKDVEEFYVADPIYGPRKRKIDRAESIGNPAGLAAAVAITGWTYWASKSKTAIVAGVVGVLALPMCVSNIILILNGAHLHSTTRPQEKFLCWYLEKNGVKPLPDAEAYLAASRKRRNNPTTADLVGCKTLGTAIVAGVV